MTRLRLLVLVAGATLVLLGSAAPAVARPLSTSAVLLDVDTDAVTVTVELPLDELSIARDQVLTAVTVLDAGTLADLRAYLQADLSASDASGRAWSTAVTGGRVELVDGVDNLVLDAVLTPASGSVGDFVLHDDAIMDQLISQRVFVSGRYGRRVHDAGDAVLADTVGPRGVGVAIDRGGPGLRPSGPARP